MLMTEHEVLREEIRGWAAKFGGNRSALMPVLQEIQRRFGHISDFAMQQTADAIGIHPVEVYGVVSFYKFLNTGNRGRFVIRLCRTLSCDMAGKARVANQLENDLGIRFGETTSDGRFSLEWANCLGLCDQGPALLVNDRAYVKVTPEKVREILAECRTRVSPHAISTQEPVLI